MRRRQRRVLAVLNIWLCLALAAGIGWGWMGLALVLLAVILPFYLILLWVVL